jgi:4-amino-4-deoxy-L-arabinose transferase-like glycosyltransferase
MSDPQAGAANHSRQQPPRHYIPAAALLVIMFGLVTGSMVQKSPTLDEGPHVARGWAFWRTGEMLAANSPPLLSMLNSLGVLLEPGLPDPRALSSWDAHDPADLSRDLLWQQGINTGRVVFLARMASVWMALLLGALLWRWGRQTYGLWSAGVGLALYVLSPGVLAHAGLATPDLGAAAFITAALYAWSRYLQRQKAGWLLAGGVLFGLAQAAKFSALVLIPALSLMTLWAAWRGRGLKLRSAGPLSRAFEALGRTRFGWLPAALLALALAALIGMLALWAAYHFDTPRLAASAYREALLRFLDTGAAGQRAYLLGRFLQSAPWYAYPIVLGVKEPLPVLLMLLAALAVAAARGAAAREWNLLFPALTFFGAALLFPLDAGMRHLLPLLPLLYLFAGRLASSGRAVWIGRGVCLLLAAALLATNLLIYPDYLAFFNVIAGGPNNGARVLGGSNLDQGQDLPALARYLEGRGAGTIYLSYFGQADPAYYGIDALELPTDPPPIDQAAAVDFHPLHPAPGLYAISATNVIGVSEAVKDTYAYFRDRELVARAGHSIYIYEVPPFTPPQDEAWFGQCAAPGPLERAETLASLTGIADLRVFTFDCQQSLPFPPGSGWLLLPPGVDPLVDLGPADYTARYDGGSPRYRVWMVEGPPDAPPSSVEFPPVALPLPVAGHLELLGYRVSAGSAAPGDTLVLTAWWRVREPPPPPVLIFAHLSAPDGSLALAGDGLGVLAEDWRPGMVLIQQHRFPIPAGLAPGSYSLSVGLYSLNTGERFPVSESAGRVVDRIVLRTVEVTAAGR